MVIIKEFKEFAMRGNVIDLAVGVVIGAAFGKIVTSLVDDIIMPPIGYVTGGKLRKCTHPVSHCSFLYIFSGEISK